MKIILLNDIKGLGKKFEVKEVKDGYAKNFLMPRNLAKMANKTNLGILAQQKAVWERQEKEIIDGLEKNAEQLKEVVLDFPLKSGENGQVFGSVSALEIKKALENLGYKDFEVFLEKPIKELGECLVEIDLGKGLKSKVKIRAHSQS
ncbi:MAG: 50S ribosomal protein L9 [Patescibacteria group bacterium]